MEAEGEELNKKRHFIFGEEKKQATKTRWSSSFHGHRVKPQWEKGVL